MNEETKRNPIPPTQGQPDVSAQLQKIQQHLIFLEKKIDTLISQSQSGGGSFQRRPPFSKPHRNFDRPRSHGHNKPGGHGHSSDREGSRQGQDRGFAKGPRQDNRPFFERKKQFSPPHKRG